jgi:hypothetical protein
MREHDEIFQSGDDRSEDATSPLFEEYVSSAASSTSVERSANSAENLQSFQIENPQLANQLVDRFGMGLDNATRDQLRQAFNDVFSGSSDRLSGMIPGHPKSGLSSEAATALVNGLTHLGFKVQLTTWNDQPGWGGSLTIIPPQSQFNAFALPIPGSNEGLRAEFRTRIGMYPASQNSLSAVSVDLNQSFAPQVHEHQFSGDLSRDFMRITRTSADAATIQRLSENLRQRSAALSAP